MRLFKQAKELMLFQFSHSRILMRVLKGFIAPLDETLKHVKTLREGRYIHKAQGATQDIIGDIVGFSRNNMKDTEYKIWLKIAVLLNINSTRANCIYQILGVLLGDEDKIIIKEYEPNTLEFNFLTRLKVPEKILFPIIKRAVPINTKCQFANAAPKTSLSVFIFDKTKFDHSVFADFFKEEL